MKEKAQLDAIAVIEKAMADRREQIRVLGQTGALTDANSDNAEANIGEIRSLYDKISGQLDTARAEARDLNRRRIELDRIGKEITQAQELLEETRRALEVIGLESGRNLPGFAVLMSPPSQPVDPADDSRKMLAAGGFAGGAGLALMIVLALGLTDRRLRFAESLAMVEHRLPVLQVSAAAEADAHAADLLRNDLQLKPLKRPRLVGKAPVIAVTRVAGADTADLSRALAASFARARMKTLYIDADLGFAPGKNALPGWRERLVGQSAEPRQAPGSECLWILSSGLDREVKDRRVSAPMVRGAIDSLVRSFDVVIVSVGNLQDRLASRFVLSAADVGLLVLAPEDPKAAVTAHLERLEGLPANGSVAVLRRALPDDPWLAVRI